MRLLLTMLACAVALGAASCGDDSSGSSATGVEEAREQLLGGGLEAYEKRIASLRGAPVVVNKWASWCGPCRAEFPFLARQAERLKGSVVFLGINSGDSRDDAVRFLAENPVPFHSFEDPDREISQKLGRDRYFPTTFFYDREGKLVSTHAGQYLEEKDLAADIERHAR